jgi:2-hydroxycyclohexanecarboxyl-CoA dehydrogenase
MQGSLSGKVALVAGSSYGIGRAVAVKLAQNGADIIVNGRNEEKGQETVEHIQSMGHRAIFEKADVTDYSQVKQMVGNSIQRLGKIDILVASGGRPAKEAGLQFFRETDPEEYISYAQSQWFSRLHCVRGVLDHMVERQSGKIVMITTDAGRWPTPGECMSGGAAAALVIATKVLAREFARWKIRINTICLTVTRDTPDLETMLSSPIARIGKKALERQPFPTTSNDVAEAALFLASPASDQITGQILSVNGGLSFPG